MSQCQRLILLGYTEPLSSKCSQLTSIVNSDDGLIRGVELKSGKVMTTLKGHDAAVRTLWSGVIDGQEILISGSFDKTVLIYQ